MFEDFLENAKKLLSSNPEENSANPDLEGDEFDVNFELLAGYYSGGSLYGGNEYSK